MYLDSGYIGLQESLEVEVFQILVFALQFLNQFACVWLLAA